jgi:hypothetical protein
MLEEQSAQKAQRMIARFTEQFRQAVAMGYDADAIGLPTYETQEDFDQYRPDLAGSNYEQENEFIVEIIKGLLANGVPARPVTVKYADYAVWLNGRENTGDNRAAFVSSLV